MNTWVAGDFARMAPASLTTHVLDTAHGRPAAGLRIDLYECTGAQRRHVKTVTTNADGRCDAPLLAGAEFHHGRWELVFHVAAYFAGLGVAVPQQPFLGEVTVAFGIAAGESRYHVPLLVSPWGYTTYRGS